MNTDSSTTGWAGVSFTATQNETVKELGRWKVAGNSGSHLVEIVTASGSVVASATVNLSSGTAGSYVYTTLGTPVLLTGGTTYYLLSQETSGSDQWMDSNDPGNLDGTNVAAIPLSSKRGEMEWQRRAPER